MNVHEGLQALILDGWHRGELVPLREPLPTLRLLRPRTLTVCDCNADGEPRVEADAGPGVDEYRIAFKSLDGKLYLYSQKGDSEAFIRSSGRAWVSRGIAPEQDVYVDCRDHRAWMPDA